MPWQLNTNSPLFRALSSDQQQQLQNQPVPPAVQQQGVDLQKAQLGVASEGVGIQNAQLQQQKLQNDVSQVQAFSFVQKLFDANKGSDSKVSPQTYNAAKAQAASLGINGDDFDKKFEQSYTNPSNYNYDTPTDSAIREQATSAKRLLQSTLDSYNAIPQDQKGVFSKSQASKLPIVGQLIAPQATEYENQRQGLSAQLKDVTGAGAGSGVRVTQTELNNWSNLLPSPTKTKTQNDYDLKQLNSLLEAKFGKGAGLDPEYLPGKGGQTTKRPSLDSFNQ